MLANLWPDNLSAALACYFWEQLKNPQEDPVDAYMNWWDICEFLIQFIAI